MQRWRNLTLGEIAEALGRYKPFVIVIAGIVLLAIIAPGSRDPDPIDTVGTDTQAAAQGLQPDVGAEANGAAPAAAGAPSAQGGTGAAGSSAAAPVASAGRGAISGGPPPAAKIGNPLDAPDCDRASGRIRVPSFYAPNCVAMWPKGADNGGATYKQGITKDTIKIAIYDAEDDPATTAVLAAAGAADDTSPEEDDANRKIVVEAFESHLETYGRRVQWVVVPGSGPADDAQAGKADAIKVATEIKAFASFGAPNNTYIDELVARGVLCIGCAVSQPIETYLKWAPYVWSTLMASNQGYVHRAEYIGKRLAGKPAKWAGDPTYQTKTRTYGLIYYETADNAYKSGVEFFDRELAKYNVKLTDRVAYTYDLAQAQEQARTIVARFKDKGITSVLFSGDPIYPAFFTKEATRQLYRPEWIITGSALTDTTLFARTYDTAQWSNAFGISYLIARMDPAVTEQEGNIVSWHAGRTLTSYPSLLNFGTFYAGVQLAGPNLNPQTFRDGLFSIKRTSGFITQYAVSFGKGLWPWDDYISLDDATEIWWDPDARGPDELENEAVGMYRYVDKGKRYLPGQWPRTEPKVFTDANTVTMYTKRPPGEEFPKIPHKHYGR